MKKNRSQKAGVRNQKAVLGAGEKKMTSGLRMLQERLCNNPAHIAKPQPADLKDALAARKLWSNAWEHAQVVKAVTEAAEEIERVKATLAALREKQERRVLALAQGYRRIVATGKAEG